MASETQAFDAKVSKQRVDYFELPGGVLEAVVTITLPNGKTYRYSERATAAEAAHQMAVEGDFDELAVEGIFGDIGKALGKVAKGAVKAVKSVATSKVFQTASKGLMAVAPALGPLAPAALAAGGVMATSSQLLKARHAASRGNKKAAAVATAAAVKTAKKLAPKQAATLLKIANDKSKAADRLTSKPPKSSKKKPVAKKAAKPSSSPAPALGAGNRVSSSELVRAARSGRVYLIKAA